MKEKKGLYVLLLLAIIIGAFLGYRAVQNHRYTTIQLEHGVIIWDSWHGEPITNEYEIYEKLGW